MPVLKWYNGSSWVTAIVGKQGPTGATGPQGQAGTSYGLSLYLNSLYV